MHYLDYREQISHHTGDFPMDYYFVDEHFLRYRMPMHWHKETELIRVRSGRLRVYLDDVELEAEAGDLLCIGGGVIHGAEPEDCVYECLVFDPQALIPAIESCREAISPLLRSNIFWKNRSIDAEFGFRAAEERLFQMAAEFEGEGIGMLAKVFEFLHSAVEALDAAQLRTVSERSWQKAEQLKPALEYIEKHYDQHVSLETLARLTGFSPKYFCRYFRTIVHRSPIDYLNYYRIERAARFLAGDDMNVAEVAVHCGYADSSAFIKQFRKYKGTTPKQYKLRMQSPSAHL